MSTIGANRTSQNPAVQNANPETRVRRCLKALRNQSTFIAAGLYAGWTALGASQTEDPVKKGLTVVASGVVGAVVTHIVHKIFCERETAETPNQTIVF